MARDVRYGSREQMGYGGCWWEQASSTNNTFRHKLRKITLELDCICLFHGLHFVCCCLVRWNVKVMEDWLGRIHNYHSMWIAKVGENLLNFAILKVN